MAFDDFGADALFFLKLHGRQEEVVEEAPFVAVEIIEQRGDGGVVETPIAEPLADMSPVFLLDMSVIVFFVRPGAGELDRVFAILEMTDEVPV